MRQAWTLVSFAYGRRQEEAHLPASHQHKPLCPPSPVYKARLANVEASASNPYVYYNMQLQAIIKSGKSQAVWVPTLGAHCGGGPGLGMSPHPVSSSRHGRCHAKHHEEICHPRHLH